jgi:hypothetical protein
MNNEPADKLQRDCDADAASTTLSQPTRCQLLKGLTTGTVAIGALSQSGCSPAILSLKTRGATESQRYDRGPFSYTQRCERAMLCKPQH